MLVLENARVTPPQLVALIVPYIGEGFDCKQFNLYWRATHKLSKAAVNWRLCAVGEAVTGFTHNSMCPFGSLTPLGLVVHAGLPSRIWLGGGAEDVKLCVNVTDLVRATRAAVVDLIGAPGQ
jgi:hypothetical protein